MSKGIRASRRAQNGLLPAALAGASLLALQGVAEAQTVSGVTVTGQQQTVASPKYTAPLLDTPQTVTIIDSTSIAQQNLFGLRDILQTLPGITFGAGEGGGGYGDSINLRGFSANSDITVDGVRDSAQYTRSDPFNLEQIEVTNGANSVYSGSGSVGGTINIVTKTPRAQDAMSMEAGIGTDSYGRVTVDANKTLGAATAVRLNLMAHQNDIPGRDVENNKRWGIAPSIAFGIGTPTEVSIAYIHQEDENIPQYGVPYFVNAFYNGPLPGVDRSNYYGYSNFDTQEIGIDALTVRGRHFFDNTFSFTNLTRYQEITQFARVDPPQGTWCLANGLTPAGAACGAVPTGFFQPSGPRGTTRDSDNSILYNQSDLNKAFATGPIQHNLVAGFSVAVEDYHLDSGNSQRNPRGVTPNPTLPPMNIASPNTIYAGPINFITTARTDGRMTNRAAYIFDNAKLSEQIQFNFGLRYETTEGSSFSTAVATPYPVTGAPVETTSPASRNEAELFSYRAGLVYKPIPQASLYVAYGNSQTPSQSSVNGSCSAATCNVDPEKGVNIEVGGKWEVDGRLLLTAAVFRNERSNYKVPSGDPTIPDQVLDGKARVDGLSLGATGRVTDKLAVTANYTYLDSEVVQSVSSFTFATTGVDAQKGNPLTNTPKHSGSAWVTYAPTDVISLAYGVTYQGEAYLNNGAPPLYKTQDFVVQNAMIAWRVNEHADLRLNVKNIADEEYYVRGRNNGWATPGEARSFTATLGYKF